MLRGDTVDLGAGGLAAGEACVRTERERVASLQDSAVGPGRGVRGAGPLALPGRRARGSARKPRPHTRAAQGPQGLEGAPSRAWLLRSGIPTRPKGKRRTSAGFCVPAVRGAGTPDLAWPDTESAQGVLPLAWATWVGTGCRVHSLLPPDLVPLLYPGLDASPPASTHELTIPNDVSMPEPSPSPASP